MYPSGENVGFDRKSSQDCGQFKFLCDLADRELLEDSIQEQFASELAANAGTLVSHSDASITRGLLGLVLTADSLPSKVRDYPAYKSLSAQAKALGILE